MSGNIIKKHTTKYSFTGVVLDFEMYHHYYIDILHMLFEIRGEYCKEDDSASESIFP
jgi:hypothetical protein